MNFCILIRNLKYDTEVGNTIRHRWAFVNKVMPWYRYAGQAPRYIPAQNCKLKYYYVGPYASAGASHQMTVWTPASMDTNYVCKKITYTYSAYEAHEREEALSIRYRGSIPLEEFNDNVFFSDWVPSIPVYEGTAPGSGTAGETSAPSGNYVSGGNTTRPGEITLYRANEIPSLSQMDPDGYYII